MTAAELDLTERDCAAEDEARCATDAARRDTYFDQIKTGLAFAAPDAPAQEDTPTVLPAQAGAQPAIDGSADDAGRAAGLGTGS